MVKHVKLNNKNSTKLAVIGHSVTLLCIVDFIAIECCTVRHFLVSKFIFMVETLIWLCGMADCDDLWWFVLVILMLLSDDVLLLQFHIIKFIGKISVKIYRANFNKCSKTYNSNNYFKRFLKASTLGALGWSSVIRVFQSMGTL